MDIVQRQRGPTAESEDVTEAPAQQSERSDAGQRSRAPPVAAEEALGGVDG